MKTELDKCYEILLNRLCYDGNNLTAEVEEQFVGKRRKIEINSGSRNFNVVFSSATAHLLVEEFAESVANLVKSSEEGFLQKIENQLLTEQLGLNVPEKYENLNCYALLTSHEILIVFCERPPTVELLG